jgi:RimJ/RimL family protein N-acetyltransferase
MQTDRLLLREASLGDAEFVLALMNEPPWRQFIANHSINSIAKAEEYIESRLTAMYQQLGFGLWLVETRDKKKAIFSQSTVASVNAIHVSE